MSAPTTDGLNDGTIRAFKPGERVRHGDLGEGVVIAPAVDGFIKVFFPSGERQIRVEGLGPALRSRNEISWTSWPGKRIIFFSVPAKVFEKEIIVPVTVSQ